MWYQLWYSYQRLLFYVWTFPIRLWLYVVMVMAARCILLQAAVFIAVLRLCEARWWAGSPEATGNASTPTLWINNSIFKRSRVSSLGLVPRGRSRSASRSPPRARRASARANIPPQPSWILAFSTCSPLQLFKDGLEDLCLLLRDESEHNRDPSQQPEEERLQKPSSLRERYRHLNVKVNAYDCTPVTSPRTSRGRTPSSRSRRSGIRNPDVFEPSARSTSLAVQRASATFNSHPAGAEVGSLWRSVSPMLPRSTRLSQVGFDSDHEMCAGGVASCRRATTNLPDSAAVQCWTPCREAADATKGCANRSGIGRMSLSVLPTQTVADGFMFHRVSPAVTRSADSALPTVRPNATSMTFPEAGDADGGSMIRLETNTASPSGSTRTLSETHSESSPSFRLSMSSEGSVPEPLVQQLASLKRQRSPEIKPCRGLHDTSAATAPPPSPIFTTTPHFKKGPPAVTPTLRGSVASSRGVGISQEFSPSMRLPFMLFDASVKPSQGTLLQGPALSGPGSPRYTDAPAGHATPLASRATRQIAPDCSPHLPLPPSKDDSKPPSPCRALPFSPRGTAGPAPQQAAQQSLVVRQTPLSSSNVANASILAQASRASTVPAMLSSGGGSVSGGAVTYKANNDSSMWCTKRVTVAESTRPGSARRPSSDAGAQKVRPISALAGGARFSAGGSSDGGATGGVHRPRYLQPTTSSAVKRN